MDSVSLQIPTNLEYGINISNTTKRYVILIVIAYGQMSSHITITNTFDNFATAPENFRVPHLRAAISGILMMYVRYAIIVVRSERVLTPCHRPVAAFPRRIPPSRGTIELSRASFESCN